MCPANADAIVTVWLEVALDELRAQLLADADFTRAERTALLARAAPLLRDYYRNLFLAACEPPHPTVH